MTPSGDISTVDTGTSLSGGMTVAQDGTIWFTGHGQIGRLTPQGSVTLYSVDEDSLNPLPAIVAGPDGSIWFETLTYDDATATYDEKIGRLSPSAVVTDYTLPAELAEPQGMTLGPDGNIWFNAYDGNAIGRITPDGQITAFSVAEPPPPPFYTPYYFGIAAGPDGNLWFTEDFAYTIGRITPSGQITQFPLDFPNAPREGVKQPFAISAGPDGNMWFTDPASGSIGRITPVGQVTEFSLPPVTGGTGQISPSFPLGVTAGPDGNIWFGEFNRAAVGKVNLAYTDLHLAISASPSPATAGANLDFTITVTNRSANDATNVVVSDPLSIQDFLGAVEVSQGTFQHVAWGASSPFFDGIVAQFGTIAPGASATLTISLIPFSTGTFNCTVYVRASESPLVASDQSATVSITINPADGSTKPPPGGTTTTPPAPVFMGEHRLYSGSGKKRKLVGFQLTFSEPLDLPTATNSDHYQLSQPGRTKRAPQKVISLMRILVSPDGLVVTLNPGKYDSKKPLRLTISGLAGAQGQALATIAMRL
jgi:virginiamycin B lyase